MGLWRIDKIAPPVAKGCRVSVFLSECSRDQVNFVDPEYAEQRGKGEALKVNLIQQENMARGESRTLHLEAACVSTDARYMPQSARSPSCLRAVVRTPHMFADSIDIDMLQSSSTVYYLFAEKVMTVLCCVHVSE